MSAPLLPTSVIGSYALPSWLWLAREAMAAGRFGERDISETLEDATRIAIADQLEAGIDVVSDGEMRRVNFIQGFYSRIQGLEVLPPARKMGAPHWDTEPPFRAVERLSAPEGLGIVEDFVLARTLTDRPLKATCPGPLTLSIPIRRGQVYASREALLEDLMHIVRAELERLVEAGAELIQLDEPNFAMRRDDPRAWVELFNATVEGIQAKIALHICFGNLNNKPFISPRSYAHLFPYVLEARADQLLLEFANRELAELDLWQRFPSDKALGVGVIDVKAYRIETPDVVAERLRRALQYVAPEKLIVVPDCGFWETPRWIARGKLRAMVEGARLVRRELQGG
ncbi:MAG: methionine synthase [Candidatus Tectimicrobiota bacterium]|nr:MAG: methionine synthase [Candidatus Tectomicrobia bacterium]